MPLNSKNNSLREALLLYAVTSAKWVGSQTFLQQIESSLQGGATLVQLREKNMAYDAYLERALAVKELCDRYNVGLIIDDNVEVARACDALGVHIGQEDVSVSDARAILGSDKVIGVSTKTVDQALVAESQGADYLGVGAIYPTQTKENPIRTSIETLSAITSAVSIPVVAIGGITAARIEALLGSGIVGVAVVSAIYAAEDIQSATRELKLAVQRLVQ
ncbi:MAG: thiamine phosphate synthase [Planctomycetia bacterium]|nr:thiamine phosphate synthase [Planctomycetia bacterium]